MYINIMYTIKYLFYSSIYIKLIVLFLFFSLSLIVAIGLSKIKKLLAIKSYIKSFEEQFWSGIQIKQFYEANHEKNLNHPLGLIFKAAYEEWKEDENLIKVESLRQDIKERILNATHCQKISIMRVCENYMDILSTFIHAIPFIGLLGTVIGLIDVFYNLDLENGITLNTAGIGIGGALICLVFSTIATIIAMFLFWYFDKNIQHISDSIDKYIIELLNLLFRNIDSTDLNNSTNKQTSIESKPDKNEQKQNTQQKKTDNTNDDI